MVRLAKARTVGIVAGHADQCTGVVVGPPVVEAGEDLPVAPRFATHFSAAMSTGVEHDADLTVSVAAVDYLPAPNPAGLKIVGVRHF
ncbi:hypothetical protein ATCCBAA256_12040 [Mycobacterium montefiorense]|nr:hypothetical protein ATCCBAA256_12040 [Mycobacterium montefiorense]